MVCTYFSAELKSKLEPLSRRKQERRGEEEDVTVTGVVVVVRVKVKVGEVSMGVRGENY